ncbi:MAG: alkaline phosphatase family protein [Myxococcota bacterium]|nr:alkaline phosphatase family protein [Myxococcota bacterium]MDW8361353.1 alkaline phosphatase family protein [Myxococcales bacterium]
MTARALIVGLDGAGLDLVRELGPRHTPVLHELMDRGAFAALDTVPPASTLPNWATVLTGLDPGTHGLFDFTIRDGYAVRFVGAAARAAPTVFARLDGAGLACLCAGFPGTWPPERLDRGIVLSGWDSPVAFEANRSFVHPPSLYDDIVARFGAVRFDDVGELEGGGRDWVRRLGPLLVRRVERRSALYEWLIALRAWDVAAVYFGESDTAAHHLWSLHDPRSPRRPADVTAEEQAALAHVYEALDAALGRLLRAAGGERVEVTVVSDHGSGGSSDKVLCVNRVLAEAGLLRWKNRSGGRSWRSRALEAAREVGLRTPLPRLRERAFRWASARIPSRLESLRRFGAIDFEGTVAFSEEVNYFPAIWLNVRGREPQGIVPASRRRAMALEVAAVLDSVRDPWTGTRVIRAVEPRERLYLGPYVERAPDLLLEMELDGGYTYNLLPSGGPGPTFERLAPESHLGRKGRSLPGSHRSRGLLVMAGPAVRATGCIDAHVADVMPALLARLGIPVPVALHGSVPWAAVRADRRDPTATAGVLERRSHPRTESGSGFGSGLVSDSDSVPDSSSHSDSHSDVQRSSATSTEAPATARAPVRRGDESLGARSSPANERALLERLRVLGYVD